MIFRFCCDESHDSTNQPSRKDDPPFEPKSYIVGGFFGDKETWRRVESRWKRRNELEGVPRYHAAHLNGGYWEFDGWTKRRRLTYSKEILQILKSQRGKLHGVSCGMHVDAYRSTISQTGQVKMGHPYLVCFKTVLATIAKQMDEGGFHPNDRFEVVLDQSNLKDQAIEAFYAIKNDPKFRHRHRLESCVSSASETYIGLQAADFVAYESFRLMHDKRKGQTEMRAALATMLGTTRFMGYVFEERTLKRIKEGVENAACIPGGLVIVPPDLDE
jgi:hypothetical protein